MNDTARPSEGATRLFAPRLVSSRSFGALFREGMALVEETAAYLDGPGRAESRALGRAAAVAYATESMRLTTRLMQLASWLLVQRAVNEGQMTSAQAAEHKRKVRLTQPAAITAPEIYAALPAQLRDLIERAGRLQQRIQGIDGQLRETCVPLPSGDNPVARQLAQLRAAFPAAFPDEAVSGE